MLRRSVGPVWHHVNFIRRDRHVTLCPSESVSSHSDQRSKCLSRNGLSCRDVSLRLLGHGDLLVPTQADSVIFDLDHYSDFIGPGVEHLPVVLFHQSLS